MGIFNRFGDGDGRHKRQFDLSELALTLDLLPIAILILRNFVSWLDGYVLLLILISLVAGFIVGIAALCRAKHIVTADGKAMAILAIAIPAVLVGGALYFYIGVNTGLISLM